MKIELIDGVRSTPDLSSLVRVNGAPYGSSLSLDLDGLVFGTNGSLHDLSGNGNNLVPATGRSVSFSGADNVEFPSSPDIAGKTVVFSGFVKPDVFSGARFIHRDFDPLQAGGGYGIFINPDGKLIFSSWSSDLAVAYFQAASDTPFKLDAWNSYRATVVDGVLTSLMINESSVTFTTSVDRSGDTTYSDSTEAFFIGSNLSNGLYFSGELADIAIFDVGSSQYLFREYFNEYKSGSLDGRNAVNSVGSNGRFNGCDAGPVNIGPDIEVVRYDAYSFASWFDGVDDLVSFPGKTVGTIGALSLKFIFTEGEGVIFHCQGPNGTDHGFSISQNVTTGHIHTRFHVGSDTHRNRSLSGFSDGDIVDLKVFYDFGTETFSFIANGVSDNTFLPGRHTGTGALNNFQLGANGVGDFRYTGAVWDLVEYDTDQTTVLNSWNNDWTGVDGATDGVVSGNLLTIGDKLRGGKIPQTALLDWNSEIYFDGVDDGVDMGTPLVPLTGDFYIEADILVPPGHTPPANVYVVSQYSPGTTGRFLFGMNVNGAASFHGIVGTAGQLNDGELHTIRIERSGDVFTGYIDGVSIGTRTDSADIENRKTEIGQTDTLSRFWNGLILNLDINGTIVDFDDGTINGSPQYELISENPNFPGVDAIGNPIDFPRGSLLNHFADEGNVQIPYDTSLDLTDAMEMFVYGNFWRDDADDFRLIDRWDSSADKRSLLIRRLGSDADGVLRILIDPDGLAGGSYTVSFSVTNSFSLLRIRFEGSVGFRVWEHTGSSWAERTVTVISGSVPSSLLVVDSPILIPGSFFTDEVEIQMSAPIIYNKLKSSQEAENIRLATRRVYFPSSSPLNNPA